MREPRTIAQTHAKDTHMLDQIDTRLLTALQKNAHLTAQDLGLGLRLLAARILVVEVIADVAQECRTAGIGCIDCKMRLADAMCAELAPIRERARDLQQRPDDVRDVLATSASFCAAVAADTMAEVRQAMGLR